MKLRKSKPRVILETQGGLGNQLFQYALGRELANQRQCALTLDIWRHQLDGSRPFELSELPIQADIISSRKFWQSQAGVVGRGSRFVCRAWFRHIWPTKHKFESRLGFDGAILASPRFSRFSGYFQSWRYFFGVRDEIQKLLNAEPNPDGWAAMTRLRLSGSGRWCAIHFRRGDYETVAGLQTHGLVGLEYYVGAIEYVRSLDPQMHFVIFSDEPAKAQKAFIGLPQNLEFLVPPDDVSAFENLWLMAQADTIVTANSTFSWWAAWQIGQRGLPVIAPTTWYSDPMAQGATRDLFPDNWILI